MINNNSDSQQFWTTYRPWALGSSHQHNLQSFKSVFEQKFRPKFA